MIVEDLIKILEKEDKSKPVRILFEKADYVDDKETIAEIDSVYTDDTINDVPTVTIICGDEVICKDSSNDGASE